MDILAFETTLSKSDATSSAQNKGSFFWSIIFSKMPLSEMRLHYVEYKLITFEAIHRPTIVHKLIKSDDKPRMQTIKMLANGSTGSVAWIESMPALQTLSNVHTDQVQSSNQSDDQLVQRARKVAMRVIHRFAGGIPELEVRQIESIYRPFWIALYGDVAEGKKARYLPIAADGCGSHRSF